MGVKTNEARSESVCKGCHLDRWFVSFDDVQVMCKLTVFFLWTHRRISNSVPH